MPLYEITAPDGSTYEIEGPEGASQQSLILAAKRYEREQRSAEIQRRLAEARQRRPEAPETTVGGNVKEFFKGVVPGAVGLVETAGTGISALLPEDAEKAAREKIKEIAGIAKKPFEAGEGYEGSIGRRLGEGIGSFLPVAPLALLGAPGIAAGVGVGVAAGAGEARERAERGGASADQRSTATALGTIPGAFDTAVDMALAAFPGGAGRAIGFVKRALISGGVEGATEAAQEVAQNAIAKGLYKPGQELVEGAGEAGATGAGVGVLASLILDMAIPGRRRGAAPTAEPKAPTEGAPAALPPIGPTPESPQGELFPGEKIQAQVARADMAGPPAPEGRAAETKPVSLRGVPDADQDAVRGLIQENFRTTLDPVTGDLRVESEDFDAVRKLLADVGVTAPDMKAARDTETRDFIDEMETADINRMMEEDKSAELRKMLEEDKAKAEKTRLKFESDLAELNGRLKAKEEKTAQDRRLEVLLPIIESDVPNIPKAFVRELKREGFTNPNLTEREQRLINRAYDFRLAKEPEPTPPEVEPSAPAQNQAMESLIPEKKTQREPEQPSFPGMGKPKGKAPEAFSEAELAQQEERPFATKLTADVLAQTGLPKQSGFFKQLLNMDMADPVQQPTVANIFAKVRTNPNVTQSTKDAIERMAMQAFGGLAKQQELFPEGKKGAKPAKPAKEKPSEPARGRGEDAADVAARGRTGAESGKAGVRKGEPAGAPADSKRTEAPKSAGLGDRGKPAADAGTRKDVESTSLKEDKGSGFTKTEAALEKMRESTSRLKTAVAKLRAARESVEEKAKPKAEPKAETKAAKPAARGDLGAYAGLVESDEKLALESLAHDLYMATYPQRNVAKELNEITAALVRGEMPALKFGKDGSSDFYPGTGGKYAKAFFESLTPDQQTQLRKRLEHFFITAEAQTRRGMDWFNAKQALDKAVQEQVDENPELVQDAVRVFMPMHPEIVAALRTGDLAGALNIAAKHMAGRNGKIAEVLAKALSGVKVSLVDGLKSPSGRSLAGDFDAGSNTVRLDSTEGMNVHALLHEATHAAVLKTLTNKSHPMTKQLNELFDAVKDSLDGVYGAKSVEEFASEAMSNPDFQQRLAQINPKGEPISALRRFFNAVGNLLRRMVGLSPKGLDSALDSADVLIGNILAPGASSLGNGTLYQASVLGTAKDVFKALDNKIIKMPGMDNQFVGGIYEVLREKIPNVTKTIILRSLPLNALTEVASRDIPMAKDLDTLEKQWNGAIDERRRAVDAAMQRIQKWIKGNPEKEATLNRVIAESTLAEVDPSKLRSDYKGKQTKSNEDKQAVWDKLQTDWKALEGEGQAIYNQMRDSYAETHEKLLNLLFKRIDASVTDAKEAQNLKTEIYKRLAVKGKIEPYFPLMRQGDYWVTFNAKGPDGNMEYYKMAFRTSVERDRAIRALKAEADVDPKSVEKSSPTGKRDYKSAPSTSFVNNILKVLVANKVNENVTDEIMRVFLDTLPESSFAQSFRTRLGTLGFETDATKVFYTKSLSMAHQLGNLEYGAKMYKLRDAMEEHVNTKVKTEEARLLFDTLDRHIKTMVAPDIAPWSKAATSTAFGFTLGFNVSSALVNLTQLPMVVMPYLGGKYGYVESNKALGYATRTFLGSGLKRKAAMAGSAETVDLKAGYSLDNYDFDAKDLPQDIKDLRELAEMSSKFGLLSRSVAGDILEMNKDDSVLTRINNWSGFIFHHGERMNRQVAMIAAYKLELDAMRKGGKELTTEDRQTAAQEAIRVTELLNGGASANSAPLLAKNSLGKIVFMYKRYGVSMYYMLFKTTRDAMSAEDPQVRAAAKRQIAGVYATSALLAGVQGVPMFGIAAAIYNLFGKDDDEDDFETAARKYMGEGMFNGALNYLTGTAVANRIGLTDLILNSTGYRDQDSAILSFLQLAGGPVYGVADRMVRGGKLIADGEVQRGLEQVMPAAFGNVMKGYRYATEGANTLRGDPIVGDIGAGHSLAQAFGFAPAEYTRQLEINASLKNIERRVLEDRTKLLRKYYVALRSGDSEGAQDVLKELIEMGRKRPGLVTPDTIKKSMAQHMRTTSTMYHGITLNKLMRAELLRNAAEYDEGLNLDSDEE